MTWGEFKARVDSIDGVVDDIELAEIDWSWTLVTEEDRDVVSGHFIPDPRIVGKFALVVTDL